MVISKLAEEYEGKIDAILDLYNVYYIREEDYTLEEKSDIFKTFISTFDDADKNIRSRADEVKMNNTIDAIISDPSMYIFNSHDGAYLTNNYLFIRYPKKRFVLWEYINMFNNDEIVNTVLSNVLKEFGKYYFKYNDTLNIDPALDKAYFNMPNVVVQDEEHLFMSKDEYTLYIRYDKDTDMVNGELLINIGEDGSIDTDKYTGYKWFCITGTKRYTRISPMVTKEYIDDNYILSPVSNKEKYTTLQKRVILEHMIKKANNGVWGYKMTCKVYAEK